MPQNKWILAQRPYHLGGRRDGGMEGGGRAGGMGSQGAKRRSKRRWGNKQELETGQQGVLGAAVVYSPSPARLKLSSVIQEHDKWLK